MAADAGLDAGFIPALHKPSALLPIAKHREALLYTVETHPVTIVVGQTGSGKSTQIPQFLEKAGWCADGKVIAITQPRRVAASTVAIRVAEEFGCELGKEVGFSIRFEDVTSEATRIKFLTDGLLIREALVDPLLSRYSVIMIDEAHERSISSDILLGLLKKIRKKRPELRIIISSATLQAEEFLRFFSDSTDEAKSADNVQSDEKQDAPVGAIVSLEGRTYPIDILYLEKPAEDYLEKAISTVFDIHINEPKGDILVFLTGRDEIEKAVEAVSERSAQLPAGSQAILPLPLYAGLPTEKQMYVFDETPANFRKVIFSTNIAEASVTIDGIVYVVDSGFVKLRAYNPQTGIETLTATPVSKASAAQRAGRAGRTKAGKCFRLYTEEAYQALPDANPPEIQRSNLAPFVLQLKALGIDNVLRFDFLTPPPAELMTRALELLYSLGALDDYAKLTKPLGLRMAELAVEPMMAKTLLSAPSFGCLGEMLTIAAMTSLGGSIWVQPDGGKDEAESARRKFAADEGDHLTLLNVYQAFVTKGRKGARFCHDNLINFKAMTRAMSIRAQLRRWLERFGITEDDLSVAQPAAAAAGVNKAEQIRRCLTTGYFAHAARMQSDGSFRNVSGTTVLHAHPSSLMFNRKADWVIFHEIMESGEKTFIRDITKIEKNWLVEYAPAFYSTM
ncbi:P-loop containing nucleoside triphosphate hydrolase protein [Neurospora hispaniola]|uniref:RNA helicase n=1 Tax=Neurospora hispaniola TaxID=588809 RepID=A0AAJ0MQ96_9PEZI|nr:P-loop containing nucleoside triphosphate hydrolase protein [Neurospora hispaniola]